MRVGFHVGPLIFMPGGPARHRKSRPVSAMAARTMTGVVCAVMIVWMVYLMLTGPFWTAVVAVVGLIVFGSALLATILKSYDAEIYEEQED